MVRYSLSQEAQDDLESIGEYILRHNPVRAVSFVDELIARFSVIAERPRSFRSREELLVGLRSANHGKYLILFRADQGFVKILRVVHGARNLIQLLNEPQS